MQKDKSAYTEKTAKANKNERNLLEKELRI